jgi:voltage-gated potassium channel
MRLRVHRLLEPAGRGDHASRAVDVLILCMIGADLIAIVLDSVPEVRLAPLFSTGLTWGVAFWWIEHVVLFAFAIEYALRLWACSANHRYRGRGGRLRWATTPLALIDLAAILPLLAYLPAIPFLDQIFPIDLTAFRTFRAVRLLRVGKLARYSLHIRTMMRAIARVRSELLVLSTFALVLAVVASTIAFHAEHEAQPKEFRTILDALWFSIVTMSTVGFGDAVPVTAGGKLVGAALSVFGICVFALPAGLLGAAFVEELRSEEKRRRNLERAERERAELRAKLQGEERCSHCGQPIAHERP